MALSHKDWKRGDILSAVVLPLVVVLVIVALSQVGTIFEHGSYGVLTGIVSEIEEMVILVGVPLLLGLIWNQWAGGSSGFLLGSIYTIWWAVKFGAFSGGRMLSGFAPTMLGYVLSAMLIGYMAGALNQKSQDFKRLLISSIVATSIGGLFLFGIFHMSPLNVVTGLDGFLLTVLTRIATGVIIAVIAKVFIWYGVAFSRKTM
ncbi:MAG: hypothetical protein NWF04_05825 [Candidatus Bathyarchaeota archaeon]|nr:hypothetical protein [Candidatus Bathyarchaeota archaeon]